MKALNHVALNAWPIAVAKVATIIGMVAINPMVAAAQAAAMGQALQSNTGEHLRDN